MYKKGEECQHFKVNRPEICLDNKFIPWFLHSGRINGNTFWELKRQDRFTFMDYARGIENQWIDRETYQKTLKVLSKYFPTPVIKPEVKLFEETASYGKKEKKIIVSGFYNEKQNIFALPETKISSTGKLSSSFVGETKGYFSLLTFQLKEKDKILQEIKRPAVEMEIELFYKDSPSITRPFDFSYTTAVFKLPKNHQKRDLWLSVLDPKGAVLYSAPTPKKITESKTQETLEETVKIDKNR